jgi:hypothetical protein
MFRRTFASRGLLRPEVKPLPAGKNDWVIIGQYWEKFTFL